MRNILIVDDEQSMCDFLSILLESEGFSVQSTCNPKSAVSLVESGAEIDMVITDLKMPEMDGIQLLEHVKRASSDIVVIMITAFATTENAIDAMKKGAYDYLTKPFKVEEIKIVVNKAFESRDLRKENTFLKSQIQSRAKFEHIIGVSREMKQVFDTISRVSDLNSTILITGESGTGKELVARAIHQNSHRKNKPFVTVNCGALPENLLESELFGHMRGAFTGAVQNKEGLFEVADGGTFLLDEVAETTPAIQVKLLRVLNDKKFKRVGGTRDISVDVRLLSATNRDLEKMVEDRDFREDLFYRLNVIPIHLPALRERQVDIPLLIDHFIAKCSQACGRTPLSIEPDAVEALAGYHWPGNIRELENVIERCVALERTEIITVESLPGYIRNKRVPSVNQVSEVPVQGLDLEEVVGQYEKTILINALKRTRGIKKDAARLLRITFRSLRYRIKKYGLEEYTNSSDEDGRDET
ncbi:sigma-54-dependent Fis family transcriptional regulator [bacterium]|nr:sigma-54-dependent Fis family transcriptional regulator [candidate division CSSED10-310 bacterium]